MKSKIMLAVLSLLIFDVCIVVIIYGNLVISVLALIIMLALTVALVNGLLES